MTHLDTELQQLRASLNDMWGLTISQLHRAQKAFENNDKELAHEVIANEKRLDAFELKICMDCENIMALFNPVANDLRFVLSVLRINYSLERIGDYARGIAKLVIKAEQEFSTTCTEKTQFDRMFTLATNMVMATGEAFEDEKSHSVRAIFHEDNELDKINKKSVDIIAELIKEHPEQAINLLSLLLAIKKLERIGDLSKDIAEEIVFYREAIVLRHKKKKEKEKLTNNS